MALDKVQFCEIGMPRTASRSLATAMKILGFTVSHGIGFAKFRPKKEADSMITLCLRHFLFGSIPPFPYENYEFVGNFASSHWKLLAETKPQLKFILTYRNVDQWWDGCWKRWRRIHKEQIKRVLHRKGIIEKEMISAISRFKNFGNYGVDEFNWKNGFERHNKEVLEYFKGSDRFLVHSVFEGDGWEKLCKFVNKEVPNIPYPNSKSMKVTTMPDILKERNNEVAN